MYLSQSGEAPASDEMYGGNQTFDFGEVTPGETLAHTFTITNKNAEPVSIKSIARSCSCIGVRDHALTIDARSSVELPIEYKAGYQTGGHAGTIVITLGAPESRVTILELSVAVIVKPLLSFGDADANFGNISSAKRSYETSIMLSRENKARHWDSVRIVGGVNGIKSTLQAVDDNNFKLTLTLDVAEMPIGLYRADLKIGFGEHGERLPFLCTLPLRWEVQSDASVSPKSVYLGVVTPEQSVEATLSIIHPINASVDKVFVAGSRNIRIDQQSFSDAANRTEVHVNISFADPASEELQYLFISASINTREYRFRTPIIYKYFIESPQK